MTNVLQGQTLNLIKYALQILTGASRRASCSLRGTHCKGNLVPSRSKLHIKYLEPRRSFGPKGVPRPLLEPYCYHSYGQHHGGCLFKEGGGSKLGLLCALLWRILTWCSRKKAQARHIHASTMSRLEKNCVETHSLVIIITCIHYNRINLQKKYSSKGVTRGILSINK